MIIHHVHEYICMRCNEHDTVLATPVSGKERGSSVQMRISEIALAGFAHKIKEKSAPTGWAKDLHDGEIYVYSLEFRCFAKVEETHCLKEVSRLLGGRFVLVDKGILLARRHVLKPNLRQRMAGVRIGVDEHGDFVVVWITLTKEGKKRLKAALPSFKRRAHTADPIEAP